MSFVPRCACVVAFVCVMACGGGSASSPTPPTSPETLDPGGLTRGRVVSALDEHQPVSGAALTSSLGQAVADESGYFSLNATSASVYPLTIAGSGWFERQTSVKVPGNHAHLSMIPTTMDMTYFDEMCRSAGHIVRWASAPTLVVETAVLTYVSRVASDQTVPPEFVTQTVDQLRHTLPVLSAGRFLDFASIEIRRTPSGMASVIPLGAVGLTWQRGLLNGFGHVAYGRRTTRTVTGGIEVGEVALDYDWRVLGLPNGSRRDIVPVEQHELGHALGFTHTRRAPSFMYELFMMTVSDRDRQAFEIYMQRPNGSQSPDRDPSGSSMNMMVDAARRDDVCPRLPAAMR